MSGGDTGGDGGDVNQDYTASTPKKEQNMVDYIKRERVDTDLRRPPEEQFY
jgi:hypothetical protein